MRIGKVFDIPIQIHRSLPVFITCILLWVFQGSGSHSALTALVYLMILFSSVLLHELGHILVARDFGCKTKSISLYPFGGIASICLPPDVNKELYIALAGPAVNAFICTTALFANYVGVPMMNEVVFFNSVMFIFNLLPSYPMDGGRILRALLAKSGLSYDKATSVCLNLSKCMSWCYIIVGTMLSWLGLIIVGILLLTINQRCSVTKEER